MTDQLYLSIWLDQEARGKRLKHFETLLRLFPFSQRPQGQTTVSVQAVDSTEPPLLERPMNGPIDVEDVLEILHDYTGDDVAQRVDTFLGSLAIYRRQLGAGSRSSGLDLSGSTL